MKNIYKSLVLIAFFFIAFCPPVSAQTGFDDDVEDAPVAPVNMYVPLAIAGAVALAYGFIKKQKSLS